MVGGLQDTVALVTGASRGLGAELAYGLAVRGAHVVAVARSQGGLEALDDRIAEAGGRCTLVPMDVTKFQDVDRLGASLYERFGRVDLWVSCAGVLGGLMPAHHVELKDLERVMRLNFTANARLIRSLDPVLRAAGGGGRALFLSGRAPADSSAYWGPYLASKAALEAYVQAYAAEVSGFGVQVNCALLPPVLGGVLDAAFPGGFVGGSVREGVRPADAAPQLLERWLSYEAEAATVFRL